MSSYLKMIQSVTTKYHDRIKNETSSFCEYFHLAQFWYNKIDDRGSLASFSNFPEWTEYFGHEKLYEKCPMLRHSKYLQEGVKIFSTDNDVESMVNNSIISRFYNGKANYHLNTWVVFVNKTKDGSEQFGFFVKKPALSLFFNESQLVRLFMKKIKENMTFVFSKLEDNQINLLDVLGSSFFAGASLGVSQDSERQTLLKKIGGEWQACLTPQEMRVIELVLQGYSASAIAPQVFLAKRTVDHYLERIKEKLDCHSKTELIQKAREMEELGFLTKKLS